MTAVTMARSSALPNSDVAVDRTAARHRRRRARLTHVLSSTIGAVVLVALVWLVWPARLGGAAGFVIVRGHSMEPTYHVGDVVYVRSTDHLRPGDIAVYRVPDGQPGAGIEIVHRLQSIDTDGTYRFLGDNNDEPDVFAPTRHDLVGRVVTNLGPLPGRVLATAPLIAALVIGLAVALLLWPDRTQSDGHRGAETAGAPGGGEAPA